MPWRRFSVGGEGATLTDENHDPHALPVDEEGPLRERMFNAPWQALAIVGLILASYAAQTFLPDWGQPYALYPADVMAGRPLGLLTSLFLHGGWPHALMNAAFALAFGAPVARLFGHSPAGVLAFFIFYLVCGVLAGLAFVALHSTGTNAVVGASGAVAGLMGAAARLMEHPGRLGSPLSRSALSVGAAWAIVNLLVAATGLAPGSGGAPIAWEAHVGGFVAGLLLVGPFARLLRR
jgi:membrane associated rhomboid family serine protease